MPPLVPTGPRKYWAIAPSTFRFPSEFPQAQLSTMNEWLRARIAASMSMFEIVPVPLLPLLQG